MDVFHDYLARGRAQRRRLQLSLAAKRLAVDVRQLSLQLWVPRRHPQPSHVDIKGSRSAVNHLDGLPQPHITLPPVGGNLHALGRVVLRLAKPPHVGVRRASVAVQDVVARIHRNADGIHCDSLVVIAAGERHVAPLLGLLRRLGIRNPFIGPVHHSPPTPTSPPDILVICNPFVASYTVESPFVSFPQEGANSANDKARLRRAFAARLGNVRRDQKLALIQRPHHRVRCDGQRR